MLRDCIYTIGFLLLTLSSGWCSEDMEEREDEKIFNQITKEDIDNNIRNTIKEKIRLYPGLEVLEKDLLSYIDKDNKDKVLFFEHFNLKNPFSLINELSRSEGALEIFKGYKEGLTVEKVKRFCRTYNYMVGVEKEDETFLLARLLAPKEFETRKKKASLFKEELSLEEISCSLMGACGALTEDEIKSRAQIIKENQNILFRNECKHVYIIQRIMALCLNLPPERLTFYLREIKKNQNKFLSFDHNCYEEIIFTCLKTTPIIVEKILDLSNPSIVELELVGRLRTVLLQPYDLSEDDIIDRLNAIKANNHIFCIDKMHCGFIWACLDLTPQHIAAGAEAIERNKATLFLPGMDELIRICIMMRFLSLPLNYMADRVRAIEENKNRLFTKDMETKERSEIILGVLMLRSLETILNYFTPQQLKAKIFYGYYGDPLLHNCQYLEPQQITARMKAIHNNQHNLFKPDMSEEDKLEIQAACLELTPEQIEKLTRDIITDDRDRRIIRACKDLTPEEITAYAKLIKDNPSVFRADMGYNYNSLIINSLKLKPEKLRECITAIKENEHKFFIPDMRPDHYFTFISACFNLTANQITKASELFTPTMNSVERGNYLDACALLSPQDIEIRVNAIKQGLFGINILDEYTLVFKCLELSPEQIQERFEMIRRHVGNLRQKGFSIYEEELERSLYHMTPLLNLLPEEIEEFALQDIGAQESAALQ